MVYMFLLDMCFPKVDCRVIHESIGDLSSFFFLLFVYIGMGVDVHGSHALQIDCSSSVPGMTGGVQVGFGCWASQVMHWSCMVVRGVL